MLKAAQEEHDLFVKALKDNGVNVLYLVDLVNESLLSKEILNEFIDEFLFESKIFDSKVLNKVKNYLLKFDTKAMISK